MNLEKLMRIDRRLIFLLIALAVIFPLLFPIGLPTHLSKPVQDTFNAVDSIPPDGPPLMLSIDYDPAAMPELYPMTLAILRHCFSRNIRVLILTLHRAGPGIGEMATTRIAKEYGKKEGEDYVYLGFKPGFGAVILRMGEDIHGAFLTDYYNRPIGEIPMMREIHNYDDIPLVICLSAAAIPELWMMYAGSRYHQTIAAGVTAVSAADYYPFLQTDQLVGLIGGLKGASEYEKLVNELEERLGVDKKRKESLSKEEYEKLQVSHSKASAGMDSQSIAHLVIIAFIVIGNVAYFAQRRKKR